MDIFETRKPDYNIKAQTRTGKKFAGHVGVAWLSESGNISIKLDAFVVLQGRDDIQITMFPITKEEPTT